MGKVDGLIDTPERNEAQRAVAIEQLRYRIASIMGREFAEACEYWCGSTDVAEASFKYNNIDMSVRCKPVRRLFRTHEYWQVQIFDNFIAVRDNPWNSNVTRKGIIKAIQAMSKWYTRLSILG